MLQIIQYQKTGELSVEELPSPLLRPGGILVQNAFSLISSGTERTSVQTAQASMLGKVKTRPDLVKQVLENVKREGLRATYDKVQNRLDNYKELGYSSAGIVLDSSVDEFKVGDRVACAGYAYHAEMIFVPKNLAVRVPENVSLEEAAFTTVGAIAMQGVRQAGVRIGETVAVIGLGLVGLISVQLLKASGCRVIGFDVSANSFELAKALGCDECALTGNEAALRAHQFTGGRGTDAVIISAATQSNEPIELAVEIARKKSKVVVVGMVGLSVPRAQFYEKELDLCMACSYGPGRYDPAYEEKGIDYPIAYVRWTENRNMESVLDLVSQGKVSFQPLITHTFPIQQASEAYSLITGKRKEKYLAILISYPHASRVADHKRIEVLKKDPVIHPSVSPSVGFIGAGNFAQSYLLPHLREMNVDLRIVATQKPVNGKSVARKFGFRFCTTDPSEVLKDDLVNTVFVASRHDSHGPYVVEALRSGKHVFVEKPLAINGDQLELVKDEYYSVRPHRKVYLAVGFNRRFSGPFRDIKEFFSGKGEPLLITYRVNAGPLPVTHWMQQEGQGGRIIGEGCHFIDCMQFLTDARPVSVYAEAIPGGDTAGGMAESVNVVIRFSDGSVGNLLYLANGDRSVDKEYCEVFGEGKTAIMNNFTSVDFFKHGKRKRRKYDGRKGHREEVEHFVEVTKGKGHPEFQFDSLYSTTATTHKALESIRQRAVVYL